MNVKKAAEAALGKGSEWMADAEFVKSCADTPLMRDVLQERDTLRERVEALTQALDKAFVAGDVRAEQAPTVETRFWAREAIHAAREAARKLVEE